MKKILFFMLVLLFSLASYSQSIVPIRADTVVVYKSGGNGNFRLENSTKTVKGGVVYNIDGKGTFAFKHSRKSGDTLFIGGDTILNVGSGGGGPGGGSGDTLYVSNLLYAPNDSTIKQGGSADENTTYDFSNTYNIVWKDFNKVFFFSKSGTGSWKVSNSSGGPDSAFVEVFPSYSVIGAYDGVGGYGFIETESSEVTFGQNAGKYVFNGVPEVSSFPTNLRVLGINTSTGEIKGLHKIDSFFIRNQTTFHQRASFDISGRGSIYNTDSTKGMSMGFDGYASSPSITQQGNDSLFSIQSGATRPIFIFNSIGVRYPEIRFSSLVSDIQTGIASGVLNSFNYSISHTKRLPLYIITSGYAMSVNHIAGNIIIRPGTDYSNDNMAQFSNDSVQIQPAGTGKFGVEGDAYFQGSMQLKRVTVADAAYSITGHEYLIAYTSISTSRAVTLLSAASASGLHFVIKDESGSASGSIKITIVGTINGVSNPDAVASAYGVYKFYSNGTAYFSE